jgi:Putative addiction module component
MEVRMNAEELKAEALRLAPEARAKLAHALLESLEDLSEAEMESLWIDEALRRDKEFDSRRVQLRRADDVLKEAKSRLR